MIKSTGKSTARWQLSTVYCTVVGRRKDKKRDCLIIRQSLGSATRTRTGVYGVRGRCPRPLDDSTLLLFSKAGAKVLLIFDIRK